MSLARQVEPLELVELLEPWVPLQLGENPTLGIYLSQDILHVSVCVLSKSGELFYNGQWHTMTSICLDAFTVRL